MKKQTPVTPIQGYVSIQCAGRRHMACPPAVVCQCTCHHGVAEVASLEPAVGAGSPTGRHSRREHDVAGSSDGAAATHLDSGLEGKGPVRLGDRLLPSSVDDELQACVDRHPSGRPNSQ